MPSPHPVDWPTVGIMFAGCPSVCACVLAKAFFDRLAVNFCLKTDFISVIGTGFLKASYRSCHHTTNSVEVVKATENYKRPYLFLISELLTEAITCYFRLFLTRLFWPFEFRPFTDSGETEIQ